MKKFPKIPPELLTQIKTANNILEIVGQHVVLRKAGANYSGLCPFHSERTPSFSVSENKQVYHCYGCKKGGDIINFIMEIQSISFSEAIEELAERAKIRLPNEWAENGESRNDPEAEKRRNAQREKLSISHRLTRFVAQYYHQQLQQTPDVLAYFRKRGVNDELMRSFYVGTAPAIWEGLAQFLVSKNAPLPLAVELGLIRPSQKSASQSVTGYFDLFRNRAMFPILDMRGKVVGFGGRTLSKEDGPKYMNSPESLIYQKSKLVYGLFQAQKHIREANEVILVEGYFDVIALHAAGFENVVATCGTALTLDHLQMFKRLADRVTILFDGDRAGVQATDRAMELGLEAGQILWGAALPENLDPDEVLFDQNTGALLEGGVDKMKAILKASQPLLDHRIEQAIVYSRTTPEAKTQAIKSVGHWLSIYRDPVGREVRTQDFCKKMGITTSLLSQAMGHPPKQHSGPPVIQPRQGVAPRLGPKRPPHRNEILLFKTFLSDSTSLADEIRQAEGNLPPGMILADLFEHVEIRELANNFFTSGKIDPSALSTLEDSQVRSLLTESSMNASDAPAKEELRSAMSWCMGRVWARFSHQIKSQIADAESRKDAELQANLMKEYLDVQRKIKEFTTLYDEA